MRAGGVRSVGSASRNSQQSKRQQSKVRLARSPRLSHSKGEDVQQRRGRVWRVGKWAGVSVCLALLAAWATTVPIPGSRSFAASYSRPACFVGIECGELHIGLPRPRKAAEGLSCSVGPRWPKDAVYDSAAWGLRWPSGSVPYPWNRCYVVIPIWIPFTLIALPTALLWYLDRRRIPVGHCGRCGYDLNKNVSGRCPECGVEIVRPPDGNQEEMASRG